MILIFDLSTSKLHCTISHN